MIGIIQECISSGKEYASLKNLFLPILRLSTLHSGHFWPHILRLMGLMVQESHTLWPQYFEMFMWWHFLYNKWMEFINLPHPSWYLFLNCPQWELVNSNLEKMVFSLSRGMELIPLPVFPIFSPPFWRSLIYSWFFFFLSSLWKRLLWD